MSGIENTFKKIDNGGKNLVFAFAGNAPVEWENIDIERVTPIFEFGRSLSNMNLDADIMFIKDNTSRWYLGNLEGIGENIEETILFLKKQTKKYNKIVCLGASAGGYGSILFGSILNATASIAFIPQTDLKTLYDIQCPSRKPKWKFLCDAAQLDAFEKYSNLKYHINNVTKYYIYSYANNNDLLHGIMHYENLSDFSNVNKLNQKPKNMIKSGELEKLIKLEISN